MRSDITKKGSQRSAHRSLFHAMGYTNEELQRPNGWKLEYYIGSNYSAGAVTLLMKFDGKQVEMASEAGAEGYKPGTIITSLYQVKSEQSTMLTFDSYNQLIHMFSGPLGLNMNV